MFRLMLLLCLAAIAGAQTPLRYETRRIAKKAPGCRFEMEYPVVTWAGSQVVTRRLNDEIQRLLLRRAEPTEREVRYRSADDYATKYMKSCGPLDSPIPEQYEGRKLHLIRESGGLVVFQLKISIDGGVHPDGKTYYVNLQRKTGQRITLDEILLPSTMEKLTTIAEAIFRQERRISPSQSLEEVGYNFQNNRFRLNENFLITRTGLRFLYNTYEISAGAMGSSEVEIPWDQIKELVRPQFVVSALLR